VDADGEMGRERGLLADLGDNGRVFVGVGRLSSLNEMVDLDADFVIVRPRFSEFLTSAVRRSGELGARLWLELAGDKSSLATRGEGGTMFTLGDVLPESREVRPSERVVTIVGVCSTSCFKSVLVLMVGVGGRALIDADGVAALDGALLRIIGDALDSTERSERSRLCVGDAALTSLERKLGAIGVNYVIDESLPTPPSGRW